MNSHLLIPPYFLIIFAPYVDSKTQREHGRKAQLSNIAAARSVADIIRTTLGPRAMLKMILDPVGGINLTNDGNAILREVCGILLLFLPLDGASIMIYPPFPPFILTLCCQTIPSVSLVSVSLTPSPLLFLALCLFVCLLACFPL